jgi:hypothetical protein
MIFLGKKIEEELVWAVRCKGCGEYYVTREVSAGELTYKAAHQTIPCHKNKDPLCIRCARIWDHLGSMSFKLTHYQTFSAIDFACKKCNK